MLMLDYTDARTLLTKSVFAPNAGVHYTAAECLLLSTLGSDEKTSLLNALASYSPQKIESIGGAIQSNCDRFFMDRTATERLFTIAILALIPTENQIIGIAAPVEAIHTSVAFFIEQLGGKHQDGFIQIFSSLPPEKIESTLEIIKANAGLFFEGLNEAYHHKTSFIQDLVKPFIKENPHSNEQLVALGEALQTNANLSFKGLTGNQRARQVLALARTRTPEEILASAKAIEDTVEATSTGAGLQFKKLSCIQRTHIIESLAAGTQDPRQVTAIGDAIIAKATVFFDTFDNKQRHRIFTALAQSKDARKVTALGEVLKKWSVFLSGLEKEEKIRLLESLAYHVPPTKFKAVTHLISGWSGPFFWRLNTDQRARLIAGLACISLNKIKTDGLAILDRILDETRKHFKFYGDESDCDFSQGLIIRLPSQPPHN